MKRSIEQSVPMPLEVLTGAEIGPTGEIAVGIHLTRGLISASLLADPRTGKFIRRPKIQSQAVLGEMVKQLRTTLKSNNFPTDEDYVWIKEGQKPWRPHSDPEAEVIDRYVLRYWFEQLCATTEPLSDEQIQGGLLDAINEILGCNLSSHQLDRSLRLAFALAEFALATKGNPLARQAAREKERRAKGPRARERQTPDKRAIVCRHAENLWRTKAAYRGDCFNTGGEIKDAVNAEMRRHGFRPISQKRIASYISEGIRGGII